MPENEREALRAAVKAHRQVIVRRPAPLDLVDEIEAMQDDRTKGVMRD